MKNLIAFVLTLIVCLSSFGQTNTKNYVKQTTPREAVPAVTSGTQVNTSIQYYDGLGRSQQSIQVAASPNSKDIITPSEYDEYGRQLKQYLPYISSGSSTQNFRTNALIEQNTFYTTPATSQGGYNTSFAYSESRYEASPLNRMLEQAAPGDDWRIGQNTVEFTYEANTSADAVKLWELDDLQVSARSTYDPNELLKNTTTDEDDKVTIQFTNKQGQTILKRSQVDGSLWADTYYIYDDLGRLKIVLPPEANNLVNQHLVEVDGITMFTENHTIVTSEDDDPFIYAFDVTVTVPEGITLSPGSHIRAMEVLTPAFLDMWAFQYEYDTRNRMTSKQVPGAEKVLMVYDQWDRLVLTQDGNQRSNNEWLFTKYDGLSRPVLTGIKVISGSEQAIRDAVCAPCIITSGPTSTSINPVEGEVRTGPLEGYSNNTYPSAGVTPANLLTVTYYDDYTWGNTGLTFTNPSTPSLTQNLDVRGQVTGTKTKVADGTWITSASYYDDKYRPIQTQSTNHLHVNGKDIVTNYYDFIGQIDKTITSHYNGTNTTEITRFFEYDHSGRLLSVDHQINNNSRVTILSNEYNELGELTQKNIHYAGTSSQPSDANFEQNVNYDYNIRGWLTSINDSDLSDPEDLFGMELHYNSNPYEVNNTNFNGNISAMRWSNSDSNAGGIDERGYNYKYDGLNRLTDAEHFEDNSNSSNRYDMTIPTNGYDLNGNIKALQRRAESGSAYMDNLSYTYEGNQLLSVTDAGDDNEGFKDGNTSGNDYAYDDNGNMIIDKNKDITNIEYNHLNLPVKVTMAGTGNYIEYLYDAAGIKLRQSVFENSTLTKTTDYAGEFIYEDGDLQLIQQEEGRIIPLESNHPEFVSGTKEHDYQYHLKDHLGNVRLTFSTTAESYERTATFEDAVQSIESLEFGNVSANRAHHPLITNTGKAARLNNTAPAGPYAVLSVNKGDMVHLSVEAYYAGGSGYSTPINSATFESLLESAINTSQTLLEGGVSTASINSGISAALAVLGVGGSNNNSIPGAYLNYLVFDRDMVYQGISGYKQVSSAANGSEELIELSNITIDREGYLVAYLSNESNSSNFVYFDDFEVEHNKTNIVQTDDYYPFGLTFNSSQRTASTAQNFKLAGNEEQVDWGVGVSDFNARTYDATIGRFYNIDPFADERYSINPYNYVQNNPIARVDPDGMLDDIFYINNDGSTQRVEQDGAHEFYVQSTGGDRGTYHDDYTHVATLEENSNGLVEFPASGDGFGRYGTDDAGGESTNPDETVGSGDHFVTPETAAGLFGATSALNGDGITIDLGDMSSSNGSDPWQAGFNHHSGHGHNGNRSGLDADFRYVDSNGNSFQSSNAFNNSSFSSTNNQTVFNTASTFGFTTNYQGTSGNLTGATQATGHNDHGHIGRANNNSNVTTINRKPNSPRFIGPPR